MDHIINEIADSKIYKIALIKIRSLETKITDVVDLNEINILTKLSSTYKNIFKGRSDDDRKIELLLDCLMIGSAYFERLTCIKNDLITLKSPIRTINIKIFANIQKHKDLHKLKKQDRDLICNVLMGPELRNVESLLGDKLDIVVNAMNHIDKLCFNIKSSLSTLKGKYNGT